MYNFLISIIGFVKSDLRRQKALNAIISNLSEDNSEDQGAKKSNNSNKKFQPVPEIRIDGPTDN